MSEGRLYYDGQPVEEMSGDAARHALQAMLSRLAARPFADRALVDDPPELAAKLARLRDALSYQLQRARPGLVVGDDGLVEVVTALVDELLGARVELRVLDANRRSLALHLNEPSEAPMAELRARVRRLLDEATQLREAMWTVRQAALDATAGQPPPSGFWHVAPPA